MAQRLILGIFDDEHQIVRAAAEARKEGLAIHDTYTPFPVPGLDEAAGLPSTRLGIVCFGLGLGGLVSGLGFQLWSMGWDWPLNIGGKSYTALPALVPATFEFTVLCAAAGTFLIFLLRVRLWPGKASFIPHEEISDNKFVLALTPRDENVGEPSAKKGLTQAKRGTMPLANSGILAAIGEDVSVPSLASFLEHQGASEVREIEAPS